MQVVRVNTANCVSRLEKTAKSPKQLTKAEVIELLRAEP